MRTAWVTLRHQPPYRSDAFAEGLERLGFIVKMAIPAPNRVRSGDVVITWNLNPRYRPAAEEAMRAGAALVVAENGYVPAKGSTQPIYALARNGHNGSGMWYTGGPERWDTMGIVLREWVDRPEGYILIADQRGIGSDLMKCPRPFYETVVPRMTRIFARHNRKAIPEFRLRQHPGRHAPARSLQEDLQGARAVVTWASNVANEALIAGIPTFRCAPFHVNEAALSDLNMLPRPQPTDRLTAFRKLAWAQWSLSEIEDGAAFSRLLGDIL